MAHHIYQTKGLILKDENYGETAKIFTVLTPDLGLIRASAQGIRSISSKLRYHAGVFSLVSISLVRGKEWWRITNIADSHKLEVAGYTTFARVADLLIKITDDGSLHDDIRVFQNLEMLHRWLSVEVVSAEYISECEVLAVYRMLHVLGYIDATQYPLLVEGNTYEKELLDEVKKDKKELIKAINTGISSIGIK